MFCCVCTNIVPWFKLYIGHIGCNQVGVGACHMFICFDCAFSTGCVYRLKNGFKVSIDNEWCRDLKVNKNVIRFIQSTPFFFHRYTTNVEIFLLGNMMWQLSSLSLDWLWIWFVVFLECHTDIALCVLFAKDVFVTLRK